MNNTEIIFFLHICRNTHYFKEIPSDIFSDKYLQALYIITKDFQITYNKLPFSVSSSDTAQIEEIIKKKTNLVMLNEEVSKDENIKNFLNICKLMLGTDYNRYIPEYIDENIKAWMDWEKFQLSYIKASSFIKSQEVTPQSYKDVIREAKTIMDDFSIYDDDGGDPKDILDPETHKQDASVDCFESDWGSYDLLCNDSGTGTKVGNLIVFVGAPNIGKTIVLGNIAESYATKGHNVLFVSLEMSEADMAERIGSNIFNISMDDYGSYRDEIDTTIAKFKKNRTTPRGIILLKRMYGATPNEVDGLVMKVEKENGIKINILVVDYLGEMGNDFGTRQDGAYNTYLYHKQNASALFNNSGKHDYTTVTAHQSTEIDPDAETISTDNLSESKGILHRPDTLIGIVQSRAMKRERKYSFIGLKTRHSKYKDYIVDMTIDYQFMRMKCGGIREPEHESTFGGVKVIGETPKEHKASETERIDLNKHQNDNFDNEAVKSVGMASEDGLT